jgi:GT2 family glycosyltransferase
VQATAVSTDARPLTVGVTTRNRPDSLVRCIASLEQLGGLVADIIVVDDASDAAVEGALARMPPGLRAKIRFIAQPHARGPIVARNTIVRLATTPYVLSLDDDAYLLSASAVRRGIDILERYPDVAAVACAQAEMDGSPWPAAMQPSPADYSCYVAAYIGFAHLVRRSTFLALGGYRDLFHFYGEEKDFCVRVLDAGQHVVYLPDALVVHAPDPAGRSQSRYLRYVVRNDCLSALYNEPLPLALVSVPLRLRRYMTMRRSSGASDPGGLRWIVGELAAALPAVWRDRRPVRWRTVRRWRQLRRAPAFAAAAEGAVR